MKRVSLLFLVACLAMLGGRVVAEPLSQLDPAAWRGMSVQELQEARDVVHAPDHRATDRRGLFAEHVLGRYDAARAAGQDLSPWYALLASVGGELPEQARPRVVAEARADQLSGQDALAEMELGRLIPLVELLVHLESRHTGGATAAAWVEASDRYQAADPEQFRTLAWYLRIADQGKSKDQPVVATAAAMRLREHFRANVLSDPERLRAFGAENVQKVVEFVGAGPDPQQAGEARQRVVWAESIINAWALQPGAAKGLVAEDVAATLNSLRLNKKEAASVASATLAKADVDVIPPRLLRWLAVAADQGGRLDPKTRQEVAAATQKHVLSDPAAIRASGFGNVLDLARMSNPVLTPEARGAWRAQIEAALLAPQVIEDVSFEGLNAATGAISVLSGSKAGGGVRAAWVVRGEAWRELTPEQLGKLAESIKITAQEERQDALSRMASHVQAAYLNDERVLAEQAKDPRALLELVVVLQGGVPDEASKGLRDAVVTKLWPAVREALPKMAVGQWTDVYSGLGEAGTPPFHKELLADFQRRVTVEGVLEDATVGNLIALRRVPMRLGGQEADVFALIETWASVNGQPGRMLRPVKRSDYRTEYWPYFSLVWHLKDERGKVLALEPKVWTQEEGLKLGVVKLVAYGHLLNGTLGKWKGELEARMNDAARSAEERAAWMLVRAYAEEINLDPPQPLAGKQWLDEAMLASQGLPIRVTIARYTADRLVAAEHHDLAVDLLREVADRGNAEAKGVLEKDIAAVEAMAKAANERDERVAAQTRAIQREAKREYLERRLKAAEASGEQDRVGRLREALAAIDE